MRPSRLLLLLALVFFVAVTVFPIYWMVLTAIVPPAVIMVPNPPLLPFASGFSLAAFSSVLSDSSFLRWLLNSLLVAGLSTAVTMVVSFLGAYSLSRFRGVMHTLLGTGLLLSKIVPSALLLIPLFVIYIQLGIFDSYEGLVFANMAIGIPLATWMMKAFIDRIPRELDQAARLDGCSEGRLLCHVILPLATPGLAMCTAYLTIVSWSEFIFARTLMRSDQHRTLTVGLQSFIGEHLINWPQLMAAGTISLVPVIILFVCIEPFLVAGATKGSLAN